MRLVPRFLKKALEAFGDDLDSAIKSLNELRLESTGFKSANGQHTVIQPSVEGHKGQLHSTRLCFTRRRDQEAVTNLFQKKKAVTKKGCACCVSTNAATNKMHMAHRGWSFF
ncbi:unnamed protein product [Urochloa humidicola]